MNWESVIGLEIHAQLLTKSKIFSGASSTFGGDPNINACAVDLGLPGVLPVLNKEVVSMAIKFGIAIDANIAERCVFARKNYFYPDLPKGYQISQYELPIVSSGKIHIELENGNKKVIGITRAHLEEDAGKSSHEYFKGSTAVDLNRAGTPLIEIVSDPDMRSTEEAIAYMKKIHALVTYLSICDGNMQEGSFRCDANVSVRKKGDTVLGTRTELKNINSFKFVEKAINFEIERQIDVLESGKAVIQETRLYDPKKDETRSMRTKEEAHDYRYFPDPDLLPVEVDKSLLTKLKKELPELPDAKKMRFQTDYELSDYDATLLTHEISMADYYENAATEVKGDYKILANWINGELVAALNKENLSIAQSPIKPLFLARMINRIADGTITQRTAKQVFESLWDGATDVDHIIKEKGLLQLTDTSKIESIIDKILLDNPKQVTEYLSGKEKIFSYFVGQVMQASQGKADPEKINSILRKKLNEKAIN
ncbi:MAG: Asp-tRNA(Asn)/Glu-tRNA(Gln) amidotransferase subunit GatB [Pseudomonadota bacterium]